ncbi:MAG: hypothetical protein NZ805_08395 [Armatimonadetes bacterium]|nr:hypothetical protein [Armatimonadota bacterium]MDW8027968.1 hypothetical protein [Armatimonadota bacterium]
MTVKLNSEQTTEFDIESEKEKRARLLLLNSAFQALWNNPKGKRTSELSFVNGTQIFLGLTRQILMNCQHLVLQGRVWNFRWRQEASAAPLVGLVTSILTLKGAPMNPTDIASIIAPWRNQPIQALEETLNSFLLTRLGTLCFRTEDGRFGLMEWLPKVEGLSVKEAIEQEFWGRENFAEWLLSLTPEKIEPEEAAKMLLDSSGIALSHREILFALWAKSEGRMEILTTFSQLISSKELQILAFGYMVTEKGKASLTEVLMGKSEEFQNQALQKEKFVETRKLPHLISLPEDYKPKLGKEIHDEIFRWLNEQPYPIPLTRIAEQVLEVLPTDPDYEQTLRDLFVLMSKDNRFVNLGSQCWWLREKMPSHVTEIPNALFPPPPPPLPEDLKGQFDLVLPIEGIDEDLKRFVEDPNYEDVGEPEVSLPTELKAPKRLDIPVAFHHLQSGTLKIRKIDLPFFETEPKIHFLRAVDDAQNELGLWVNLCIGLCFGLSDWYSNRKVEVGGIVRLEKTKGSLTKLIWTNRYDRWLHIPKQRLEDLVQFAAYETIRQAPLVTLVQSLLTQHPKGVHFLRLWSELNVLRRTTKIALASILCSYPMFVRVQEQDGYWTLDFTKFNEGIKPEKIAYLQR